MEIGTLLYALSTITHKYGAVLLLQFYYYLNIKNNKLN